MAFKCLFYNFPPGMDLTLPQLCQNYMLLCVRIGKLKVSAPALNA
jgi:hypothetical protein